jgi:hypothetical protein
MVGLLYKLRSGRHGGIGYFQIKFLIIGGVGSLTSLDGDQTINNTEVDGLTGHLWRSDHPRTGVGGLTGPGGSQTARGSPGHSKIVFSRGITT